MGCNNIPAQDCDYAADKWENFCYAVERNFEKLGFEEGELPEGKTMKDVFETYFEMCHVHDGDISDITGDDVEEMMA